MAFRAIPSLPHPGFVAGRYYTYPASGAAADFLMIENTLYFLPFFVPKTQAFDRLSFWISTGAGAAENEVRTGIYRNANGTPGTRLVDNGRSVVGTGTNAFEVTISQVLSPGWYWLAIIANRAPSGSATQPTIRGYANTVAGPGYYLIGTPSPNPSSQANPSYRDAQTVADWTTYTLPATAPTTSVVATILPLLWLRAA